MPPPQKACPASARLPGPAGSAPSVCPLGTARVVGLLSGKGWPGPPEHIPGPDLGGVLEAASVAPTAGSRFAAPVTGEGQSNRMTECRDKDRIIAHVPRSAFVHIPDDTPDLSVICGPLGAGWYPRMYNLSQWQVEMYALELELQPYDFVHKVSAREISSVRKLFLGMTDYLHMCVAFAAGEYVPWDKVDDHHALRCRANQIHCLTSGKSPCGDHHAHHQHHRGNNSLRGSIS